ncbi:MAG TPA: hypothetical protein VFA37_07955 [Gaiellaceae bacterium]|nr:hypothetical protein [Gaiellaceae bacterium]
MRNPFRSESSAFHFLLLTVGAFGIVAAASAAGGPVAAIVAWAAVSAAAVALYVHGRERRVPETIEHAGPPDERRVVVVAPLEASPLHRLANDVDAEQAEGALRAAAAAEGLGGPHLRVVGVVGEEAVEDTLHTVGGDEIVVLPGDASLAEHLRERYALPVSEL